jgi:hypothetical protein
MNGGGFLILLAVFLLCATPSLSRGNAIDQTTRAQVKESLLKRHGQGNRFRIERGVEQAALFWRAEDGTKEEFASLCEEYFVGNIQDLDVLFQKMEANMEIVYGYFTEMRVDLRRPLQLDWGEILPIDMAFGKFNPAAHLVDDLFENTIAFTVLLNFPHYFLEEKMKAGPGWSRKEWAHARMGDTFLARTPAAVAQDISNAMTSADTYISQYNIYVGNLVDDAGQRSFPADMKLISHWGLRDELKARYNDPAGLPKQRMLTRVMERIIAQEIPQAIINSQDCLWNPFANRVTRDGREIDAAPERDTRYQCLLDVFQAIRLSDPYNPFSPTHVSRRFDVQREIPESRVEALFTGFVSSPVVRDVAGIIEKKLGRKLEPFDIWYNGFRGPAEIPEEELDRLASEMYPDLDAFKGDLENIFRKLGFSEEIAAFVAPRIRVDPARGAGHCVSAGARSFSSRLRTRVPPSGMNYKGFNVAMHELGHAVEQTLTLQQMDYYSLTGVPNTAFTEAFAFMFQDRDFEILGIETDKEEAGHLRALDILWNAYEIMGVSLVDMKMWNWLYAHPGASAGELKEAVLGIAKDVWNSYYADIFGVKDQIILAVYSHMIDEALYLPDYPLGHLIQFQIEHYVEGKVLGEEMTRMCASGSIIPDLWMQQAVGSEISSEPLITAASEAVGYFEAK